MDRKKRCAECRYCRTDVENKKGETRCCERKPALPLEGGFRPACAEFQFPAIRDHWGA